MRAILVMIAGGFMILSAFAHGFGGWSVMRRELAGVGAKPELVGNLGAGWLFGSAAMATFGTIVVTAALRLRRGDRSGVVALRTIAACYVIYGSAAFIALGNEPFFLILFVTPGLLAGLPTFGDARAR